jgi:hypothetical protein
MNKWLKRYEAILEEFTVLKTMTKVVPARTWTAEYRVLAEKIHAMGRDYFHTEIVAEMLSEKAQKMSPLEAAYRAMCKLQVQFPHCPFCGRRFPGQCQENCAVPKAWAAVRAEQADQETMALDD